MRRPLPPALAALAASLLLAAGPTARAWDLDLRPRITSSPEDHLRSVEEAVARAREEAERLRKLVAAAEQGRVPYAGMTPEWVLEHSRPGLAKAEARWRKKRERYEQLWIEYQQGKLDEGGSVEAGGGLDLDAGPEVHVDVDLPEGFGSPGAEGDEEDEEDEEDEGEHAARVTYVFGVVEVWRDGSWVKLAVGDELDEDTRIRTQSRSKVEMVVPELRKIVRVKPNTEITVGARRFLAEHADKPWMGIFLLYGGARFLGVKDLALDAIRTPKATVGTRGTTFTVDVAPDGSREVFAVTDGIVEVTRREDGKTWELGAGQRLTLPAEGPARRESVSE